MEARDDIGDKGHYLMMTRLILQEDLTVPYHVCVCAPNNGSVELPGAKKDRLAKRNR